MRNPNTLRRTIMQSSGMARIRRKVILKMRILIERRRPRRNARITGTTALWTQRTSSSRTTEECIFLTCESKHIALEAIRPLKTREGGVNLADGDGVLVLEVPLLQCRAERAVVGVVGVSLAFPGRESKVARWECPKLGWVLRLCWLQEC